MAGSGEQFVPMYFVFVAFILGALTFSFTERFTYGRVPYVFLMFMEGVALGYLANSEENSLGDFSQSFLIWQDIDPFLLLAVFLPGLLFGDGMETETYQLARIAPQLVLLCLVGTVIMTCLMAVVSCYFLVGGTWKIYGCFLFGAILSSPDPVVLINLLESTSNAPEKYKLLTGSESHFCDMTSFTLFTVFFKIVTEGLEKEFGDAAESAQFFAFNILGGPITGLLLGFLAYYMIVQTKLTGKPMDSIVQITITVVCAYLAFLISEHVLSGNGILATIVASLILAAYAKSSYVDAHSVETVWKVIEFLATTIVIFLSGVIASKVLFDANIPDYSDLFIDVLIVYASLMVSRVLTIALLYVPLDRVGDYSMKEAVCMSWCNIRGALTLTLALAVVRIDTGKFEKALNKFFFDATVSNSTSSGAVNTTLRLLAAAEEEESKAENPILKEQLSRFYLIVALTVLLTIMINYTMADRVFRATGLLDGYTKRNKIKDKTVRAYIDVRIRRRYREILHALVNKYNNHDLIDLDFLDKSLIFFIKREYTKAQDGELETSNTSSPQMTYSREELADAKLELASLESKANPVELNKMQALFYKALKQSYWSQIESGIIPKGSAIALKLLYSANIGADEKMVLKSDFEALNLPEIDVESKSIGVTTYYGRFISLLDYITAGKFDLLSRHERALLREAVYVCTCYVDAHQDAEEKIAGAMGAGTAIDTYEEATVIKRSMLVTEEAKRYMDNAKELNKDVEILVETLKIGSAMIVGHQKYMSELKEEGLVEDYEVQKEFELLKQQKAVIQNREGFSRAFHKEKIKRIETEKELNRGRVSSFLGSMRKKSKAKKTMEKEFDEEKEEEHIVAKLETGELDDEDEKKKAEEEASTRKLVPKNNVKKDV